MAEHVITVATPGYAALARNMIASAERVGLTVYPYVMEPCSLSNEIVIPTTARLAQGVVGRGDIDFWKIAIFKLHTLSTVKNFDEALYVDADTVFRRNPMEFFRSLQCSVCVQGYKDQMFVFGTGIVYARRSEYCTRLLCGPRVIVTDENAHLNARAKELEGTGTSLFFLPSRLFPTSGCLSEPDALVVHLDVKGIDQKVALAKQNGLWHAP